MEGSLDVETEAWQTVGERAANVGKTGAVRWRIGGQTFTTEGCSALAPAFGGRETDGYINRNVNGRVEVALTKGVTADFRTYYSHGRIEIDASSGDTSEYALNREFVGYGGPNIDLLEGRFRNRFGYGYTNTSRDNYNPARTRDRKRKRRKS